MLTKATVIGTGAMGTTSAEILAGNEVHVALFGRRDEFVDELRTRRENPRYLPGVRLNERVVPTADARAALANTELVIAAVPCQHLRAIWREIAAFVPRGVPVCSVIKGIEIDTLDRPCQILAEETPGRSVAALSGPSIAPELARCLPATVVAASADAALSALVQEVFSNSWLRVYTSSDLVGVELAGATKNVIAIAAGILDGLRAGDNAKAALLTRGLVEIRRLGVALGADAHTFDGLAGIGDLVTTCVSPIGRNRSAGEQIGKGMPVEQVIRESASVIEGIPTTRAVLRLADRANVELPITQAVNDVLFEDKTPLQAITELMQRPLKAEGLL